MQTMINPGRLPGSLILRALLEVMLPAGSALAADGVIEINQARARAGGVSADDEPGFPVTPSRSGSYRKLQVNVQVPLEAPVGDGVPISISVQGSASQAGATVAVAQSQCLM